MSAKSAATESAARALWNEASQHCSGDPDVRATAEYLLTKLEAGLRRWIGAEGYAALLARSTAMCLPAQAALAGIADLGVDAPSTGAHQDGKSDFTEDELGEAMIALLNTMMTLLGGIIGDDIAIRLLTLSGTPGTQAAARRQTQNIEP